MIVREMSKMSCHFPDEGSDDLLGENVLTLTKLYFLYGVQIAVS